MVIDSYNNLNAMITNTDMFTKNEDMVLERRTSVCLRVIYR